MNEYESLNHTKWECKYHVVFIPKYRRKASARIAAGLQVCRVGSHARPNSRSTRIHAGRCSGVAK